MRISDWSSDVCSSDLKGEREQAIAAYFRVTPAVVSQRLKLASVSHRLHEVYAAGDMTLDQLHAFTVRDDHDRQERKSGVSGKSVSVTVDHGGRRNLKQKNTPQ